jgi:hypothetical protein
MSQETIRTDDGRTFYDMSGGDNPCLGCAVCCMHYRVSFYQGEMDSQPGGYVPSDMAISLTPFRACMKGTETAPGRCIALGEDKLCTIYEHRPSVCREFPALLEDSSQNPECIRLQALYGIRRK